MAEVFLPQMLKHRVRSGFVIIGCIVIAYGGYRWKYPTIVPPRYILAAVQKGTLVVSVSGSGQVSSESQIDLKPKTTSNVIAIRVKVGDQIKKDDIVMELDRREQEKSVRDQSQAVHDAEISLASANLTLQKLKEPPTASALLLAQDALHQVERDLDKLLAPPNAFDVQQAEQQIAAAEQSTRISSDGNTPQGIRNAYDATVGTLKSTMLTLQKIVSDADSILAIDNTNANAAFAKLMLDQSRVSLASTQYVSTKLSVVRTRALVDALANDREDPQHIDDAADATKQTLAQAHEMLSTTYDVLLSTITSSGFSQTTLDGLKSTIQGDRTDVATKLSSVTTQQQAILTAKSAFQSSSISLQQQQTALAKLRQGADARDVAAAREKVSEKQQALADVESGATATDIALAKNTLDQRVASLMIARAKLADAVETLRDNTIRAPFDGIVASIAVQSNESVTAATVLGTIIMNTRLATVTLNEVDVAKIKVGQKTMLTFDAVDGLEIAGEVAEIETIGTVTQGVVNYKVKIAFDTQDDRVKPGMSARAAIITETKSDVWLAPNAAVKTSGQQHYVEVMNLSKTQPSASGGVTSSVVPSRLFVEIGSANEKQTEIVSGLSGTESLVVQTVSESSAQKTSNSGSILPGLSGGNRGGAGAFRGGGFGR